MFCGLLKSKFYSKCKEAIKLTKTRIELIKNKRNAMQKFMRNDIADLLKAGLDINAYGRAEGLLVELNRSSCYDLIEQFCGCASNHVLVMSKQRECPEECREAVSSLVYAAARFADLPELRQLRRLFTDRYGNSLEVYISHELIKKLKPVPPTKDMKLQLMEDIAIEAGNEWNSKALEQKLYNPPAIEQDQSKDSNNDKNKLHEMCSQTENNVKENPPIKDFQIDQNYQEKNAFEEDDSDKIALRYMSISPPYTKPNITKKESSFDQVPRGSGEEQETGPTKSKGKDKPKPRSVRRRWRKQEDAKHGIKISSEGILDQLEEEEEKLLDRFLIHYSKKNLPHELTLKQTPSQEDVIDTSIARTLSFPSKAVAGNEATKGHVRASSFEPDMVNPKGQVYQKQLDYDDFVARLTALKREVKN